MRDYAISEFTHHLSVAPSEVNLDKILATGQVFRWRKEGDSWFGVIRNNVWVLRQDSSGIHYRVEEIVPREGLNAAEAPCSEGSSSLEDELRDYLNLSHSLATLSEGWTTGDPHLSSLLSLHHGLRLIRQEPYECLLAFITSSCNNIPRISSLMLKLSSLSKHHTSVSGTDFHTLPDIATLTQPGTEQTLRALGFGYRAKYIVSAIQSVSEKGGTTWLDSLREVTLSEARQELGKLAGVGPKVASCVCLMSLDKQGAVPIDTHIYQVAVRFYGRPNKALTPSLHNSLEGYFQKKHGEFAGWAQAYLFYSNMKKSKKEVADKRKSEENTNIPDIDSSVHTKARSRKGSVEDKKSLRNRKKPKL